MQDCIGQEFDGVVSAVTAFGLFVELKNIFVEGLIHVTALSGDYYHFDRVKQRLTGERTRVTYRLGGELRVRVVRVDLDERKIDFELVESKPAGKSKRRGSDGKAPAQPSRSGKKGRSGKGRR
jgi:ribonuclease R